MTGLARAEFSHPFRNHAQLSRFSAENNQQPVGFAPVTVAKDNHFRAQIMLGSWHSLLFR
jgi:hypothetical protein